MDCEVHGCKNYAALRLKFWTWVISLCPECMAKSRKFVDDFEDKMLMEARKTRDNILKIKEGE